MDISKNSWRYFGVCDGCCQFSNFCTLNESGGRFHACTSTLLNLASRDLTAIHIESLEMLDNSCRHVITCCANVRDFATQFVMGHAYSQSNMKPSAVTGSACTQPRALYMYVHVMP